MLRAADRHLPPTLSALSRRRQAEAMVERLGATPSSSMPQAGAQLAGGIAKQANLASRHDARGVAHIE